MRLYMAYIPPEVKPLVDILVRLHTGGATAEDVETLLQRMAEMIAEHHTPLPPNPNCAGCDGKCH